MLAPAKRETLVGFGTKMTADRATLFNGGDELIAAAEELVQQSRAAITDQNVALLVNPIESRVLLVRVANWRFLATRDPTGPATFKTNADYAVAAIAALEKAELPDSVRPLIGPVKASLSAYMSHFDSMVMSVMDELKPDQERRSVLEQHGAASRRHGGEDRPGAGIAEAGLGHD